MRILLTALHSRKSSDTNCEIRTVYYAIQMIIISILILAWCSECFQSKVCISKHKYFLRKLLTFEWRSWTGEWTSSSQEHNTVQYAVFNVLFDIHAYEFNVCNTKHKIFTHKNRQTLCLIILYLLLQPYDFHSVMPSKLLLWNPEITEFKAVI